MNTIFTFVFVFLFSREVLCAVRVGGESPVDNSDAAYVNQAKQMFQDTLQQEVVEQPGCKTTVTLKNVDAKKQVVAGIRYNLKAQAVYESSSTTVSGLCECQPSQIYNCKASFWVPLGDNPKLQYTNDGLPQCSEY